jgi:hypothetical protein
MVMGSMPRDGGNLILSVDEKQKLLEEGVDQAIIRPYVGSNEFINGKKRYCLWMNKDLYENNRHSQDILDRVSLVKKYREKSKASSTRKAAKEPWSFVQRGEYEKHYGYNLPRGKHSIIIPEVSSENRIYVPLGFLPASTIIFNKAMVLYDAPLWLLGVLQSKMHMIWLRSVGGKLETRLNYSKEVVYNTFPVPELSTRRKNEIEDLVWKILDIRDEEGGTLAKLYGSPLAAKNPKPMNPRLKVAHEELDQVVDRAYRDRPFKDDNERLALLLDMYSKKVNEEK